ncbi:MAG: response regulator [Bryobacteraceae bacterium]|jgi:signal transduction histidine kinase/CheY-like chemotaxis protein
MQSFRDVSIKRKLIGIIMATTTVALLLACATFLAYELVTYRSTVTQQLATLAQIVAESSTAALAFEDRTSARETLAALRAEPNLEAACIYTRDGRPFAAFLRSGSQQDLPGRPGKQGAVFQDGHLVLFQRVVFDGDWIGTIYVKRNLKDMYARLERYAGIVLGVLLFSSLAALLVSSKLQRLISEPTLRLAQMASRVSAERDYSLRAAKRGNDEIGVLVDSFNEMMGQIQARTLDLHEVHGALERHVGELCDEIARRQRAQEETLAAKQAAEESSRAKSAFLANMSHELRTPLNAIIGYSEMLREDAEDQHQERSVADLARITKAGKHLLTLINEVLDLSKVEAGKTELVWEDAPVARLLEDAADAMAPLASNNGNKLIVHCAPNLPAMHVDVLRFRQSLYNLLSNAFKFTKNGTIGIDVVPVTADGTEWIEWRVSDTGIGIAADQMNKLFQPFSQVDASTTRNYGGTGLGLAISQRFCELLGGSITVVSELGAGSTFTIRLPLNPQRHPIVEQPVLAADVTDAPATPEPQANTVLVIDDDPTVHDLMARSLTKQGFDVVVASSGADGLRKAREIRPAAITLDVFMPGIDGWTVLSALKADPVLASIPVVLLTISDDRRRACLLGAAEFLQKPVDPERLAAVLQRCHPDRLEGPVLVVDDDAASRDLSARALRKQFGNVIEAEDGRAALESMVRQKPGLIVLDLTMPGMDGFDFIAGLRQVADWRKIPIVVLSAREVTAAERKRLSTVVRRILRKGDFPGVTLASEIADLLRVGQPEGARVPAENC